MRKRIEQKHSIDILFSLIVFFMFTFSAVTFLLLAIQFYQTTLRQSDENAGARVAVAYVREVMHQSDTMEAISVGEFDEISCIVVKQADEYVRYLYFYDGMLRELYTKEDAQVTAADGEKIVALKDFSVKEIWENVFAVECEDLLGNRVRLVISEKSGMGGLAL